MTHGHTFVTPATCDHPDYMEGRCNVCDGGLAICTTCNGAEGTLATRCPGFPVPGATQDAIYAGRLDYREGGWVAASNRQTSFS